jgi:hypothetical protein
MPENHSAPLESNLNPSFSQFVNVNFSVRTYSYVSVF